MRFSSGVDVDDYAAAPEWRGAVAVGADAVMLIGCPAVLIWPGILLLVVTAIWVIPLMALSIAATVIMWLARRQPNGDSLTAGQLLTGLAVVRGDGGSRVVCVADAPEALRPSPARIARARTAFALAVTAAVGIWGTAIWVASVIPR